MPKSATKRPVQPVAPVDPGPVKTSAPLSAAGGPAPAPVDEAGEPLELIYTKFESLEYSTAVERGPLYPEDAITMLGWITEEQYQKEMVEAFPASKPEDHTFGDNFHCVDTKKKKVRTERNGNNRPFDKGWADEIMDMILKGQWAGPHTVPDGTVNGETIRLSRYARVLSGQHQLTALILADEKLQASRLEEGAEANPRYPFWVGQKHCFIETVVSRGLSEDRRILMTVDYNKPRTLADVFYTSDTYQGASPQKRKELCKMLASAVDLLWKRTKAQGYATHPELVAFMERHPTILECVTFLFDENTTEVSVIDEERKKSMTPEELKKAEGVSKKVARGISRLYLSPGQMSAVMYLMACGTEKTRAVADEYKNMMPPVEKILDFGYMDRAKKFWSSLASKLDFLPLRKAFGLLYSSKPETEDNKGQGGNLKEQLRLLTQAWDVFKDHEDKYGPPFGTANEDGSYDCLKGPDGELFLAYTDKNEKGEKLPDNKLKLCEDADFDGIDSPEVPEETKVTHEGDKRPAPASEKEMEEATQNALRRRMQAQKLKEDRKKRKNGDEEGDDE